MAWAAFPLRWRPYDCPDGNPRVHSPLGCFHEVHPLWQTLKTCQGDPAKPGMNPWIGSRLRRDLPASANLPVPEAKAFPECVTSWTPIKTKNATCHFKQKSGWHWRASICSLLTHFEISHSSTHKSKPTFLRVKLCLLHVYFAMFSTFPSPNHHDPSTYIILKSIINTLIINFAKDFPTLRWFQMNTKHITIPSSLMSLDFQTPLALSNPFQKKKKKI